MKTTEDRAEFFSTLFPKNCFSDLVHKKVQGTENEGREAYKQYRTHLMGPALYNIIMLMAKAGELAPIEGIEGHDIWIAEAWNNVASGVFGTGGPHGIDWVKRVVDGIDHALLFRPVYMAQKLIEKGIQIEEAVADAYQALVTRVAAGNLNDFTDEIRDNICSVDDIRYNFRLTTWRPSLWYYDTDAKEDRPIAPLDAQAIQHLEFECKTGNLLVADWFRLPQLQAYIGERDYSKPSINSVVGRVGATEHYLSKGMLHVFVSNTCPTVMQNRGGDIVVGRFDDEAPQVPSEPMASKGMVCTDLWWTTMIERERLEEIVAEQSKCSAEEAKAIVAEYLKTTSDMVTELKVEPGIKHLYFTGDEEQFAREFHAPDLELSTQVEPMFVLTGRAMELTPKPAAAAERDDSLELSM